MHDGCCLHRSAASIAPIAGVTRQRRQCIGSAAMIRVSSAGGVRNISNAKGFLVNCFLGKLNCLPSSLPSSTSTSGSSSSPPSSFPSLASSASEFTTSATAGLAAAVRERAGTSNFADRKSRNPIPAPPSRAPLLDVSAGGGERPRKPRQWRTKTKKGSIAKSEKLIEVVRRLPNSKEEVYGALDAWIAWDLEFPLIAVKKALKTLKDAEEWRRVIQVSKWMLDKGQGRTLATYQLLLQAFDHEGRIEEAEILWEKVLRDNMECIPRTMFGQVINMYHRYGKYKEILKIFADMDELQVKPEKATVQKVAQAYKHFGYEEYGQSLLEKYPSADVEYKIINGKKVRVKRQPNNEAPESERTIVEDSTAIAAKEETLDRGRRRRSEERSSVGARNELREPQTSESSHDTVEDLTKVENRHTPDFRPTLETSSGKAEEGLKVGDSNGVAEVQTLEEPKKGLEGVAGLLERGQVLVEVWRPPLETSSTTGSKKELTLDTQERGTEAGSTLDAEGGRFDKEIELKEKPAYKTTRV